MKRMKIFATFVMLFMMVCAIGFCASKTTVKVSKKTIEVGQSASATFNPKGIKKSQVKKCTWSSSDNKVVKITTKSTKGKKKVTVKGVKKGSAYIKVKCNKKSYKVKVTVKEKKDTTQNKDNTKPNKPTEPTEPEQPDTPTLYVTTSKDTGNLRNGDTVQILADKTVYYAVSSKDFFSDYPCVEVSNSGVITAKYVGSTKVLVTTDKYKANAYTLGNPFTFSTSDCVYVDVTVGYDAYVPQYNDYQLKPAYDPAAKPISNYSANVFYVANHKNTHELFAKTGSTCLNCYNTYTSKSTGEIYSFLTVEFEQTGINKIDIYEKNPTGGDKYAYTGYSCSNENALANSVAVNVVNEWDLLITEIKQTYTDTDENLFTNGRSYAYNKFKNLYGVSWVHNEAVAYGATGYGSRYCNNTGGCIKLSGDCVEEAWFMANLCTRLAQATPSLSGYTFSVEKASQGGANHHNCEVYKDGVHVTTYGASSNTTAYLLVEFNPSNEYVLNYHYYTGGNDYVAAKNNMDYIYK